MKVKFELVFNQLTPVYLQIVNYYKTGVAARNIKDGDDLPSRRDLAIGLAINPNTAQKAYAILQDEGLVATTSTSKSVAVVTDEIRQKIMAELSGEIFARFISGAKELGMDADCVVEIVKKRWNND